MLIIYLCSGIKGWGSVRAIHSWNVALCIRTNTRTEQLTYSQHTLLYGVGRFNGATETKGRWWNSWDLELCSRYHSLQSSSRNITFSGSHFTIVLSHLFAFRNNHLSNCCWEILREMKNTDLELFPFFPKIKGIFEDFRCCCNYWTSCVNCSNLQLTFVESAKT